MHDTKKVVNTTIGNARSTIGNINNNLVNPRKRVKNRPDSESIKRIKTIQSPSASASQDSIYDINENMKNNEIDSNDAIVDDKKTIKQIRLTYHLTIILTVNESEAVELSVEEQEDKSDEEVKFNLNEISMELEREPTCKWEVCCINVTDRFRQYQKEVLKKAQREGLKALLSIMVLCWPCPYPMFTKREWKEITNVNPYSLNEPPLSPEISLSLYNATRRHLVDKNVFIDCGSSDLSRAVSCSFNDLFNCVPNVAPIKLSEEHACMFLYPISRPFFTGSEKEYELRLNRADKCLKKRPDLSCTVDGVSILNSEIKPLGYTPLQQKKDRLKAQLRAQESINLQLYSKRGPGEAGIFLNMGFVTDRTTIPLAESAIGHLVTLEERVGKISEDYKYRKHPNGKSLPPVQLSFIRTLPEFPQVKKLIH